MVNAEVNAKTMVTKGEVSKEVTGELAAQVAKEMVRRRRWSRMSTDAYFLVTTDACNSAFFCNSRCNRIGRGFTGVQDLVAKMVSKKTMDSCRSACGFEDTG